MGNTARKGRKVQARLDRRLAWWNEFVKRASPMQLRAYRRPGSNKR
jgi:hypothetical protein